jgi:flagellar motor switch protein FliG
MPTIKRKDGLAGPVLGQGFGRVPEPESKYRRTAKFLILIGAEQASQILSQFTPEQVEAISKEIVSVKSISTDEAASVLAEFRSLLKGTAGTRGYAGRNRGGVDEARSLLYAAFGPRRGELLLEKALPKAKEEPFDFLKDFSGVQMSLLLKDESPAMAAMILSRLPSQLAASVISNMEPDKKVETVKRISRLGQVSPEVLERVASALKEKARKLGQQGRSEGGADETPPDGLGTLASILKNADVSFGDKLLQDLAWESPKISRALQERLYTLDDLVKAEDRPVQEQLSAMEDRDIALLLRGRGEAFKEKILSNVSSLRRQNIKQEDEIMGAVPKVEADVVAKDFLVWFRDGREHGRIMLKDDEDIVV